MSLDLIRTLAYLHRQPLLHDFPAMTNVQIALLTPKPVEHFIVQW